MGVSVYPVFDRDVAGYDVCEINGKALVRALDTHSDRAVTDLMDFYSISPVEAAGMMGLLDDWDGEGEPDLSDFNISPEKWFEASVGLTAVRAALQAVRGEGQDDAPVRQVIRDLEDIEKALALAQEQGARFHFALDV